VKFLARRSKQQLELLRGCLNGAASDFAEFISNRAHLARFFTSIRTTRITTHGALI
jgi:hypothetical protein